MKKFLITLIFLTTSCAHVPIKPASFSFTSEPNIRVKVAARHIIEVPLESYLAGVIGHEMSPRWPREALKAQTVAARSYALYQMQSARARGRDYDVTDSQADQVFKESGMGDSNLQDIVHETRGLVIWKKGQIVQAFYSSSCGGRSETASAAGFSSESPLKYSKTDTFCVAEPFANWSVSYSAKEITQRLIRAGFPVKNLSNLCIEQKNPSGYVQNMEYVDASGTHTVPGHDFRQLAGNMRLKSLLFDIRQESGDYVVTGHGFGHGVGLCQYGAKEMANRGIGYRKILAKYYFKTQLKKLY